MIDKAHEKICVAAIRQRRAREGKPPAQWVMEYYWQSRRVAAYKRVVKTLALVSIPKSKTLHIVAKDLGLL